MLTSAEDYELDDDRLDELEAHVVAVLAVGDPGRTVACAVVDGGSSLAAFGRTLEARSFPGYDFAQALAPYEERSLFIYTVDLQMRRVAHVKRVVLPREGRADDGRTGIEVIDDRLVAPDPDERARFEEIAAAHHIEDIRRCINLTTNLATDRGASPTRQRPYSLLSYRAVFEWGTARRFEPLFACVNRSAVRSIGRVGIRGGLLLDREFHLPEPTGGYDLDYLAVHIDGGARAAEVFTVGDDAYPFTRIVAAIDLPVVVILDDEEVVLDLRDDPTVPMPDEAEDEVVIDLRDDPSRPMPDRDPASRRDRLS